VVLDPVLGEIFEAGVKSEWFDGRLGINAALFRIERDDVPVTDPNNGPGEFFSVNGGKQRADGFEVEVNGEPLPGWQLSFAGILLDSEFITRGDGTFGNSPRDTADWQLGLYTSYELQSGPLQGLGFGAGLYAVDDRSVSEFEPGKLEGYERVDLQVFYNGFRDLSIALLARNVFDEKYVETLSGAGSGNTFGSPTAYLLTVRYDFKGLGK
jgi:iron complex outermembrane receptor protein